MGKPLKNILEETIIYTERTGNTSVGVQQKVEPFLIQLSGRETGQNYNLSGSARKRIGRDASCEICVDDPHVSRVHAEFVQVEGKLAMRDLGSTNGIFINGNRIKEQVLNDGDKILVGTRLYFRFAYQDAQDQNYQQNLFKAANMDAMTQLYNKKYFLDALPKEMSFARRANERLSLLIMDIDFFKKINDTYGHLAGDTVLKAVGAHLSKHVRLENIAARYGGEEFAIILRNCNTELAHTVAERLRTTLEAAPVTIAQAQIPVTMSIGVATLFNDNYKTIEEFIQAADERLYEAKQTGRNRTVTGPKV